MAGARNACRGLAWRRTTTEWIESFTYGGPTPAGTCIVVIPPPGTPPPQRPECTKERISQDLYVIRSETFPGLVKVGRSNKPTRRLLDLSGGQPVKYELVVVFHGAGEYEPAVHHHLAAVRHTEGHSREWFRCTPDDVVEALREVAGREVLEQMEHMSVSLTVVGEDKK